MNRKGCFVALAAGLALAGASTAAEPDDAALLDKARGIFKPLPVDAADADHPVTPARVALGRALFFEPRVSADNRVSCATCHQPSFYGAESLALSIGLQGKLLPRNTPTVFNTALQFVQHYGGNRVNVEEQAVKATLSPFAYGNKDFAEAEARLKAIPAYKPMFEQAFPGEAEPITIKNWGTAIGAYERTLISRAPFDRYLAGDTGSLNAAAKRGLDTFIGVGCAACHSGVTVGGQMYQKFGLTQDYWLATGSKENHFWKTIDKGRFHDTKSDADAFMFKVQQLRNVAVTPPYFHDGSVEKLDDAVRIMAKVQLGKELSQQEVGDIVAFLHSLTGDIPAGFATPPQLPVEVTSR